MRQRRSRFAKHLILFGTGCVWAGAASGQGPAPDAPLDAPTVARVNGEPIHADEVRYFLPANARPGGKSTPASQEWKAAVQTAVDRRLVVSALSRQDHAASDSDVDQELRRVSERLGRRGVTLDEYLAQRQLTSAGLRHVLRWQLTWRRYLSRALTDENLQRYFERRPRDFDGTQLRVAHIWLRSPGQGAAVDEPPLRRLADVRRRIQRGELTFEEAAARYSEAPTAKQGGEIGWISRREPMSAAFSNAAFELDAGQMSQPVKSSTGVHLIRCLEVRPGKLTWIDK